MTAPVYFVDGSPLRDPLFTAVISERMRVPERLRVPQAAAEDLKARAEDLPAAFSMHVPDRLALTGEETATQTAPSSQLITFKKPGRLTFGLVYAYSLKGVFCFFFPS